MMLSEETDFGWRDRWIRGSWGTTNRISNKSVLVNIGRTATEGPTGACDDPYWVGVAHAARVATCMLREGFITRVYRTELIGSLLDVFVKLGIRHG